MKVLYCSDHVPERPAPWWFRVTNTCRRCGSQWAMEPDDKRVGWFARVFGDDDIGRAGTYSIAFSTTDDGDEVMVSWCPRCGEKTRTYSCEARR